MPRTNDRRFREAKDRRAAEREIAKQAWAEVYEQARAAFEARRQELRIAHGLDGNAPAVRNHRRVSENRNQTFHRFVLALLEEGHLDDAEQSLLDKVELFLKYPTTANRTRLLQQMRLRPDLLGAAEFVKFA